MDINNIDGVHLNV